MKAPSRTASRPHRIICPFCESGKLVSLGHGFARCDFCRLPLLGSTLETLGNIIGLPDALGAHPCECGHPEMRLLPDGVFHCSACGSEVLPLEASGRSRCK
jgi:ribosomal protein L37AE/L43A